MRALFTGSFLIINLKIWDPNMSDCDPLVVLDDVGFCAQNKQILNHITLTLDPQSKTTVIGPNGAGKTTLLNLILGALSPTSGAIQRHKHLKIGYCPQKIHFNTFLKLNVLDFLKTLNMCSKQNPHHFQNIVDMCRVDVLLHSPLHTLSGGEIQRVLLCRSLLQSPNLLILDEPTQGMDINAQKLFYDLLENLSDHMKCAVLMVSHDLNYVSQMTQHVVCLNHHICCQGSPSNVSDHAEYQKIFGASSAHAFKHYTHEHTSKCQHDHLREP